MITRHLPTEAEMERLAKANEYGLSVFYSKDNLGFKVLGGGWITKN